MWRVYSSTMTRRDGLSCRGKDAKVLILSVLVDLPSSWRSKIAGYADKEFVHCCLLHFSANVEADFGGRTDKGRPSKPFPPSPSTKIRLNVRGDM